MKDLGNLCHGCNELLKEIESYIENGKNFQTHESEESIF